MQQIRRKKIEVSIKKNIDNKFLLEQIPYYPKILYTNFAHEIKDHNPKFQFV